MKQCFHFSNIKSCINISNSILKFFKFEMIRNLNVYSRYAALTRHINIKRLNITTNAYVSHAKFSDDDDDVDTKNINSNDNSSNDKKSIRIIPKERKKKRLDEYLISHYPQFEPKVLRSFIMQRKVRINGKIIDKIGSPVLSGQIVHMSVDLPKFVSRAGAKLDAAINYFKVDVKDKICLDAGIGTGGFTDCLLQNGAKFVYGVDVGYGDVAYKLRVDPRVKLLERTNIRYLDPELIEDPIDIVTLDLSFISVLKVIPNVCEILNSNGGHLLVLIKPQFEANKKDVEEYGIVRNQRVHKNVIKKIRDGIVEEGFEYHGVMESPLRGADSQNIEYMSYFTYG